MAATPKMLVKTAALFAQIGFNLQADFNIISDHRDPLDDLVPSQSKVSASDFRRRLPAGMGCSVRPIGLA